MRARIYRNLWVSEHFNRHLFARGVPQLSVSKPVKMDQRYTAREAASLLDDEVTEATVKEYCKRRKLAAKKVGPRKRWMISGAAIHKLRKQWGID